MTLELMGACAKAPGGSLLASLSIWEAAVGELGNKREKL